MANTAGGVSVVSNPHLPDIFVDEAIPFDNHAGVVRIPLASLKTAEPGPSPMQFACNARLVLPVAGAQRLALALFDYLKKQGLDPATIVGGGGEETPVN